jgi:hypothetical protein
MSVRKAFTIDVPQHTVPKTLEMEFPLYLKYTGEGEAWEDYRHIVKMEVDGDYIELAIHKFYSKPAEYSLEAGNRNINRIPYQYFEDKDNYTLTDQAEFIELLTAVKHIVDSVMLFS